MPRQWLTSIICTYGGTVASTVRNGQGPLGLVPPEMHHPDSITHPNVEADYLSRTMIDRHDWQLNPVVFQCFNTLWGPLEVDLFASRVTRQLDRFFSWKPDPLAEAVDAFRQS